MAKHLNGGLPLQAALTANNPHESWVARFAASYHAAEDFTAFVLVVRAAEDRTADVFPHTLFGAARFLLLRLLQVHHPRRLVANSTSVFASALPVWTTMRCNSQNAFLTALL